MKAHEFITEAWSQKYKSSINCSHPKGFSQKAHCAGKRKHNESIEMEMVCEDCGMCRTHGSIMELKTGAKDANGVTRCWPGKHAEGTKTGKNGGQVRKCVPNESIEEDDDTVAAFVARGGEIQQLKPQRVPKRAGVSLASKHIGSGSGRGTTKGKVSGLGANTGKTGKPVVTAEQGVAEGLNDTIYPNAEVIKSRNGKPVGEIYQDENGWGAFHYRADRGYDFIDSREEAIEALKDLHQETGRSRPDYTVKGVAEGLDEASVMELSTDTLKQYRKQARTDIKTTDDAGLGTDSDIDRIGRRSRGIDLATLKIKANKEKEKEKEQGVAEGICSLQEAHAIFDDFEQAMAQRGLTEDVFDTVTDEQIVRETAAWRRSAGKSAKGGLNRKGVASYRAEHPGSHLQMAVTTKPSKLKPGSKAAKRRKSFCARMSGVNGPMKKPNGKPTRKALALRKWNC